MDLNRVFTLVIEVLCVWLAVTVHEASHAWAARSRGDSTAADQGRATLNPLPHLDLFGTIVVPAILSAVLGALVFGWGRPAPLDATKLRRPDGDDVFVILAGVAANALLALLAVVALHYAVRWIGGDVRQACTSILELRLDKAAKIGGFPVVFTLIRLATINGFLVLFNLVPLPPLDGGRLALIYLPADWAGRLAGVPPIHRGLAILFFSLPLLLLFLFVFYSFLQFVIALP